MAEQEQKNPKRRFRLRFSLLTLLILITVIAVAFGWWSHGARMQREAVVAFEAEGGRIKYDFEAEELDGPIYWPWPRWLVAWLGKDYFCNVVGLDLDDTQVTDEGLKHLEELTA
ncbi:MAG: hypothetical protein N2C12_01865, partial [Planctomycetales bacterium]